MIIFTIFASSHPNYLSDMAQRGLYSLVLRHIAICIWVRSYTDKWAGLFHCPEGSYFFLKISILMPAPIYGRTFLIYDKSGLYTPTSKWTLNLSNVYPAEKPDIMLTV